MLSDKETRKIARIESYNKSPKVCLHCNSNIPWSERVSRKKFCGLSCSTSYNNKGVRRNGDTAVSCVNCDLPVKAKAQKYCSVACYSLDVYNQNIINWKNGIFPDIEVIPQFIKKYLLNKYSNKCQDCGWSKKNPVTGRYTLQVDHIDGDCKNHQEENLRLLCPNCHSLTPTYGYLNAGKSTRVKRRK